MSNWIETQYLHLLEDILEKGVEKKDRTGTGTLSIFGRQIRHNMKDGFPLLTTKKMAFKTMVTEYLPGPTATTVAVSFFSLPKSGTMMFPNVVSSDSWGLTITASNNASKLMCVFFYFVCNSFIIF